MKFPHLSSLFAKLLCPLFTVIAVNSLAEEIKDPSRWQISLAVGAGVRTNPVMDNDDIPVVIIPQISYQGDRFFIQNLDFGYTICENELQQFNLLITPSYDQVFFNRWDTNNFVATAQDFATTKYDGPSVIPLNQIIDKKKLHPRRMAALAGFEYSLSYQEIDFQLQALHEVTQYYFGDEIRIALSKNIITGKNTVKMTAGANWQSSETINYFYGLEANEAFIENSYLPSSGITTLLRVDWNYQLNSHWSLRFFTSVRHLSNAIVISPLITKNNSITAFAGGVYHF